jgi:hypothetical protein
MVDGKVSLPLGFHPNQFLITPTPTSAPFVINYFGPFDILNIYYKNK